MARPANTSVKYLQIMEAIKAIINTSKGKWVSATENPINKIYDSVNLDKNVRSYLTKTLKSYGYVEHESDIAGMKYKFNMNFIEDIEKIAKEVLELHIKKDKNTKRSIMMKLEEYLKRKKR